MPQQLDHTNEHVVVLDDDIDLAAALEEIEGAGGRVLHRIDDKTLIVVFEEPAAALSRALPCNSTSTACCEFPSMPHGFVRTLELRSVKR